MMQKSMFAGTHKKKVVKTLAKVKTPPRDHSVKRRAALAPFEDDTEYESRVVDEAFIGKWFPAETNRQARGAFIVDDNPVSYSELQKTLQSVPKSHSVLVVPQLTILPGCAKDSKWGWVQTGMGPHYGSLFTMATCRQEKRVLPCVQKLAEEGKLWCAVLASKTMMNAAFSRDYKMRDDPPYWLVSLHKVVYTVPTQKAYKTLLEKAAPDAIELKRNDLHRRGDLFYPRVEAELKAERYRIPESDYDYWGDLANYEHTHWTNRHFVQSTHNPNQKDRLAKDVKYVKNHRPSYIHVGCPRTDKNWKRQSFAWRDSGIQFYDERYGASRNGCGLQPHGGLVPIGIFRSSIKEGQTLAEWAGPRCKQAGKSSFSPNGDDDVEM
eukprot:GEMP01021467.1.p1 GENE.GEMP01021467.1~~GEMP01021467.1.p1  ORF type:complete len:380 (+),score=104.92 GEMP01021467.1:76-1215(+)